MKFYPTLLLLSFPLVYSSCYTNVKKTEAVVYREEIIFDHFLDSLKTANSSDVNILNEIRHYLSQRIDLGLSRDSLAYNYHKLPWDSVSAFHCIELFQQNKLTAKCGLSSYILAKLYDRAGYEAYTYSCGYDSNNLSHEFVLVKLNGKLIVEDPFFDITITDKGNNPIDFLQLLPMIKDGKFSDFKVVKEEALSESWLNTQAELDSLLVKYKDYKEFYERYVKEVTHTDNRLRILVQRNFNSFTSPTFERIKLRLKEDGLKENVLSIYLKPLHVRNGNNGENEETLEDLIKSVALN